MISFEKNIIARSLRESQNQYARKLYEAMSRTWHNIRDFYYFNTSLNEYVEIISLLTPPKMNELSFFQAQLAARYLAIEGFENKNRHEWKLYETMVKKEPQHSEKQFSNLIESFNSSNDISGEWSIIIDKDNKVIDGRHRLALHIYNCCTKIHVKRLRASYGYGTNNRWNDLITDWGFTNSEVEILHNKYCELYNKAKQNAVSV